MENKQTKPGRKHRLRLPVAHWHIFQYTHRGGPRRLRGREAESDPWRNNARKTAKIEGGDERYAPTQRRNCN